MVIKIHRCGSPCRQRAVEDAPKSPKPNPAWLRRRGSGEETLPERKGNKKCSSSSSEADPSVALPPGSPPAKGDLGPPIGAAAERKGEGSRPRRPPSRPSGSGLAAAGAGCSKPRRTPVAPHPSGGRGSGRRRSGLRSRRRFAVRSGRAGRGEVFLAVAMSQRVFAKAGEP